MKKWYVIFTKTGREEKIIELLKKRIDGTMFTPFVLKQEKVFKRSGRIHKDIQISFPGYVFIESDAPYIEFYKNIPVAIREIKGVYRILDYGDKYSVAMHNKERLLLEKLYDSNFCLGSSIGIIEGDQIIVNSGALKGMESVIKKINRHKREAIIEIMFLGDIRQVAVSLEIVEKIK